MLSVIVDDLGLLTECEMLIREDVLRFVSQLFQVWHAGVLDHGWRAAQDHQDVGGRSREMLPDHVEVNKA